MTNRRNEPLEGRRVEDRWLGRAAQIVALGAALVATLGFVVSASNAVSLGRTTASRVDTLSYRTRQIENSISAVSYMTCVNFAETHPISQVPAFCDNYTRTK
jgi:hypothetical protein